MKQALYILDAYGLIYRSYFAFMSKPLLNQEGTNVSAIYGFFNTLHSFIEEYKPELFVAAFDSRTPTFRHEMYDLYKANRAKTPEDLHAQVPIIEEILRALGVPIVRQDGFEADDIIASVAHRCKEEDRPCFIISGDKDLMQLVAGPVKILKQVKNSSGKANEWILVDSDGVKAEWGIGPDLMLDYLSLTGDASDNIPGVKGVGDKTALKLLEEFGSLDGIYAQTEKLKGALASKIIEGRQMAYFSKRLIALHSEVPLEAKLETYSCIPFDTLSAARLLMRDGLPKLARLYSGKDVKIEEAEKSTKKSMVHSEVEIRPPLENDFALTHLAKNEGVYKALFSKKELSQIVDEALSLSYVAFDCETTGLDPLTDHLVGFSLSLKVGQGFYIPLRGPSPDLGLEAELGIESSAYIKLEDAVFELARLFSSVSTLIILHNGKFDISVLRKAGVFAHNERNRPRCKIFDTMIASWILDPDWASFSLESLARSQLGLETISYADTVPKGKTFADVGLAEATQYAGEDADITLALYKKLAVRLEGSALFELFYELEMPLVTVLADMEAEGIRIEKAELDVFSAELGKKIEESEKEIFALVGHEFNIASPKQLQEVLFVERKLSPGKKTKTGYSTDTSVLEDLSSEDPVPGKILDFRALAKLKSTYVDTLPSLADKNGRVHTSFIQTGTATGRLSSRDPNLQNIPIRDENGRKIRAAFRAKEGFELISADYAQIELVILAHLSGDVNLIEAFNSGVDVHRRTASLIFRVENAEVTPDMRRVAKTINFGVMYGMSAFRLANELRIPRGEAAGFINTYFDTYSGVASFMEETKALAKRQGYVETIFGRRRYVRGIQSQNKMEVSAAERIAINSPIQGSAADIVKKAMLSVDEALSREKLGAKMLLQVHDELILECPEAQVGKTSALVKECMEKVVCLQVPLRVSVESGTSWGDFH